MSSTPSASAEGSLYSYNNIYIELAAGASHARRGLITYLTLMTIYLASGLTYVTVLSNTVWITGAFYWGAKQANTDDYIFGIFMISLTLISIHLILKYSKKIIRLENFVQRRLLIRFNRITRQVYLHRPKFAGGITVLDWDQITPPAGLDQEESTNTGRQLTLLWEPSTTGLPNLHFMFVGKIADGTSDIANLWEFIRLYMEEGPLSVPPPKKLLSKIPWPWQSVMASFSFFRPLWRNGLRKQVACWVILTSPALAIHAFGHWLSLLPCWEPRWPRIIREAGLPGKPVPPFSTAADWPPLPQVDPKQKAHKN
ncbi:DUF6708 domain-containing protein [Pseudomonas sp. A014]|uniref:DUF6708 domain-containing protein n=1 Tax=Pseudomonas sp. A014 TaxID=3458058 RepID=UPI004035D322